MTRDAIELLIGKVNGNTRLIVEETRKLLTFSGEGAEPISERLVADLVPNFGDADFFEAADAFYSMNLSWTLEALRRHFFTQSESRPLLGSLQSRNRLLIQLRVLLDAGAIRLGGRGISKSDLESAARTYGHHFGAFGRRWPPCDDFCVCFWEVVLRDPGVGPFWVDFGCYFDDF